MKIRIGVLIVLILSGIIVTFSFFSRQADTIRQYNSYLANARINSEKEIPYIAVKNYLKAFSLDASDESVYIEYLSQASDLGGDYYSSAVTEYIQYFPNSSNAYEQLCQYYYEQESYQMVLNLALEAREKGIATELIKNLYMECSMMYRKIAGGFDGVNSYLGDIARVNIEGKYGFISESGSYVIMPNYDGASFFLDDYTAVLRDGEWYMMNDSGYKVARTNKPVDSLNMITNDRVLFELNGKWDYMDSSLTVPENIRFDDATLFKNGIAAVKQNGKWSLINTEMQQISDATYDDILRDEFNTCINNGVIFAKQNGKYCMLDAEGNIISDKKFDDAYSFVGDEPAAVCIDGKWGFVDAEGNMVIEPQYDNAKSFNIGLGAVCIDGMWGFINSNNEIRIECQFEDCLPFSWNGVTAIYEDGKWTYIKLLPYI